MHGEKKIGNHQDVRTTPGYPERRRFSDETVQTMKSPVARIAVLMLGTATLVLVIQIVIRVVGR
jgi:hypothetical protein